MLNHSTLGSLLVASLLSEATLRILGNLRCPVTKTWVLFISSLKLTRGRQAHF